MVQVGRAWITMVEWRVIVETRDHRGCFTATFKVEGQTDQISVPSAM